MLCPMCSTEIQEVALDEKCQNCGGCVNPWSPQLAIRAFSDQLQAEQKLILLKSVADWKTIIEAQIPAPGPFVAPLTEAYTLRLLQWVSNNPPTPVTVIFVFPADNELWRVERSLDQRYLNTIER